VRTNDLVLMLSSGISRTNSYAIGRRFGLALFAGFVLATVMLMAIYGVRSDMPWVLLTGRFWFKAAFPVAVVAVALGLATRLSRPGARLGTAWFALAVPLLAIWISSALVVLSAPPALRLDLVLGSSWRICTMNIAMLSVPTFVAVFWAMRGLAPTRLMLAGAGAGLLAGAQGALVYTLYCVETTVPFWGVWYVLGMLVPTIAGGVLGPRLLRW
jgi:hypothetical protein